MVQSMLQKKPSFNVCIGIDGFMLVNLTGGMGPIHNIPDALGQIFLGGIFRFVSLFYLWDFANTVRKVDGKTEEENETETDDRKSE